MGFSGARNQFAGMAVGCYLSIRSFADTVLAYRHLFHAGNFADVFKHAVLVQLAVAMGRKDKPYLYVDTHAGIGRYDLSHAWARKNAEYLDGIALVYDRDDYPDSLEAYMNAIRGENGRSGLRYYPGSPALVHRLLRNSDRMALSELNRKDFDRLRKMFAGTRRVQVRQMDGYQALKASLPPTERRALILIDSSFDRPQEFRRIVAGVADAHKRFATGVYAIWYPIVDASAVSRFEHAVAGTGLRKLLRLELSPRSRNWQAGLRGSAMLIINPPYRFDEAVLPMLHWLWEALSPDREGGYAVKWLKGE